MAEMGPPSQTAALVANIVQAGVFSTVGPFVCVYGPSILRVVIALRSLFAMNYVSSHGRNPGLS